MRAVERSDARFICALLNDASVQYGWGTTGVPISLHRIERDLEAWIESERESNRPTGLIVESLEHEPVGLILVHLSSRPNQSMATLSIALQAEWQGMGFGRDALGALIDALFDEWRVHRVQLTCEADNERAARLYMSLGLHREATRREATWTAGEFRDQHVFGMLATDPRPERA
jgi:RimJ/RimL family protein N-acetyltransferase